MWIQTQVTVIFLPWLHHGCILSLRFSFRLSRDAATTASSVKESAQQQWGDPGWLWLGLSARLTLTACVEKRFSLELFRETNVALLHETLCWSCLAVEHHQALPRASLGSSFSQMTECCISRSKSCIFIILFKFICCNDFCSLYLLHVIGRVLLLLLDTRFLKPKKIKCQFILVTLSSIYIKKTKKNNNYRASMKQVEHTSCVFVLFHKFLLIFFPFYFSNVNVHSHHHTKFNLTR